MTRGRDRLNKRIERLPAFRELTDPQAAALLSDEVSRTISAPLEWDIRRAPDGTAIEVRFEIPVFTSSDDTVLTLRGRITLTRPDKSHWVLLWGSKSDSEHPENLRRLDLRDSHRNPDGTYWHAETHKHLWSESSRNAVAYTPTDIPHDQSSDFDGTDDYRAVFEAFVAECKIELGPDYKWSDPPLLGSQQPLPNWEVP